MLLLLTSAVHLDDFFCLRRVHAVFLLMSILPIAEMHKVEHGLPAVSAAQKDSLLSVHDPEPFFSHTAITCVLQKREMFSRGILMKLHVDAAARVEKGEPCSQVEGDRQAGRNRHSSTDFHTDRRIPTRLGSLAHFKQLPTTCLRRAQLSQLNFHGAHNPTWRGRLDLGATACRALHNHTMKQPPWPSLIRGQQGGGQAQRCQ